MPRKSKKGSANFKSQRSLASDKSDVTVYDYANSTGRGGRLKKSASNSIVKEVKRMTVKVVDEEEADIAWFDKDLDEFDISRGTRRKSSSKHKRKEEGLNVEKDGGGVEYPLDVWFVLSEYIRPEDTASFAAICRGTQSVVNSPKFWFCLYKRYYRRGIQLPSRLEPENMERPHSLRACVVRALFYCYPPFVERVRCAAPFSSQPHSLLAEPCLLAWHRNCPPSPVWDFFFKFHNGTTRSSAPSRRQPDLLDMLGDVHTNSEEGCRVLQVTCLNFVSVPPVMGMFLAGVHLNVGHKMKHKLRLTFSATPYFSRVLRQQQDGQVTVTCDPVANIRVLDWWNPHYPYRHHQ